LSLGDPLDGTGSGLLSIPILVDHPAVPAMQAEVRLFSQGLLIEKADSSRVPVLVSLSCHVSSVWVLEAADLVSQAFRAMGPGAEAAASEQVEQALAGLFVVFQLKSDFPGGGVGELLPYSPMAPLLPFTPSQPHDPEENFLALFLQSGTRAASSVVAAVSSSWKSAMRANDVAEHRGSGADLPDRVLRAFGAFADWFTGRGAEVPAVSASTRWLIAEACLRPALQLPGIGALSMRWAYLIPFKYYLYPFVFISHHILFISFHIHQFLFICNEVFFISYQVLHLSYCCGSVGVRTRSRNFKCPPRGDGAGGCVQWWGMAAAD